MAKKPTPTPISQEELLAFFNATEPPTPTARKQKLDEAEERRQEMFSDVGCKKLRIWGRIVEITGIDKKNGIVNVRVDNEASNYRWPFIVYNPFINLEILDDCGYLDRFGNGEEYVVDGKRYGVMDDVVWAGGRRYLSTKERMDFGSFQKFLAGKEHTKRRTII